MITIFDSQHNKIMTGKNLEVVNGYIRKTGDCVTAVSLELNYPSGACGTARDGQIDHTFFLQFETGIYITGSFISAVVLEGYFENKILARHKGWDKNPKFLVRDNKKLKYVKRLDNKKNLVTFTPEDFTL